MKTSKLLAVLIIASLLLFACGQTKPTDRQVTSFSFTDQDGKTFGTDQLAGKVWIADFIFTNCLTVCTPMSNKMAELQTTFKEHGIEVEFVTFTVDPETDTPEVLKDYIGQFTDDESNWHLLTGYSQDTIEELAINQFRTIVQKPDSSGQVIHGTIFFVIDQQGYIVDEFNYMEESVEEQILDEVARLVK
ncbi:SCO family protein [Sporosarcina sp. ACRSL]|uniref:SCO family protein n=1 Tax=Sporosarcina sp. ACRSL TaxID=2918215 RepID=UPI001EF49B3D|nr:SCO family protein [Sporosarcina sp. ACRSL]MCG7344541.1 SCO family protein [Sporosarcina sp. ACRSL]